MLLFLHKLPYVLFLTFLFSAYTALGQTVVYVTPSGAGDRSGASWGNALSGSQLQPRLASATAGTQFWIMKGRYGTTGGNSGDRSVSFVISSGVQVYGGFEGFEGSLSDRELTQPSSTTFSGELGNPDSHEDNAFHVITFGNASTATRIDGVVVTRGWGSDGAGIYVNGSGAGNRSDPTIANCYITDNVASYGGGIYSGGYRGSANPTVTNCVISRNRAYTNGGGVYNNGYQGQSNPVFTNCLSFSNVAADGGAFYNEAFSGTCNPVFNNCTIANNRTTRSYFDNATPYGSGAMYNDLPGNQGTCNPILTNCLVWGNTAEFAPNANTSIYNNGAVNLTITYSTIQEGFAGTGNDSNNPNLLPDFRLTPNSPAIDSGDPNSTTATVSGLDADLKPRIRNNRIDRGAIEYRLRYGAGFRVYVTPNGAGIASGSSWTDALSADQFREVLTDCLPETTFWLSTGLYTPTKTTKRDKSFVISAGIQLYGGFVGNESQLSDRSLEQPSSTTLSGNIGNPRDSTDNSFSIITFSKANENILLDGFTVSDANGASVSNHLNGYLNGFSTISSARITNCFFYKNPLAISNSAHYSPTCSLTITNSQFVNNGTYAYGGSAIYNDALTAGKAYIYLEKCQFIGNKNADNGSAIFNDGFEYGTANIFMSDCIFSNNRSVKGGAISIANYSSFMTLEMNRCQFLDNRASEGGVVRVEGSRYSSNLITLRNSLVGRNSAAKGGFIYAEGELGGNQITILNSVIISNSATIAGGVIFQQSTGQAATGIVSKNSFFWQNQSPDGRFFKGINATTEATYSNIQGGFSGTGNIDADPRFVDPANGNFRLQPGSPSINTGDPNSTTANVSATDLAGNPRIDLVAGTPARIDMGAYERQTVTGPIVTLKEGNWNDPATWLFGQIPATGDVVLLRHRVGLPVGYVGNARTVQYDANGQLVFSSAARLVLKE